MNGFSLSRTFARARVVVCAALHCDVGFAGLGWPTPPCDYLSLPSWGLSLSFSLLPERKNKILGKKIDTWRRETVPYCALTFKVAVLCVTISAIRFCVLGHVVMWAKGKTISYKDKSGDAAGWFQLFSYFWEIFEHFLKNVINRQMWKDVSWKIAEADILCTTWYRRPVIVADE